MAVWRRRRERQPELWVAADRLPTSPGHVFYLKLNELLAAAGFDAWVEAQCEPYYALAGRPSIPPGTYFRMLLIGYFEGLGSQRGIAWRCADSLSLQTFLGLGPTDDTPHHTSLSVIRERLPHAVHQGVFTWVLTLAREKRLLSGKTLGVDSTTLEANAAMKAIVRKDSGDDWRAYLAGLMREAGQLGPEETPSAEDLQRFDRRRKDKSASNEDWESPSDPDSRIARLKDGTTHLAYKTEYAADRRGRLVPSDIGWRSSDADPA